MLHAKNQESSSTMPEVPVNGEVLKWARTIRGLEIDEAARFLGIPTQELREYEAGTKRPLVGFLRQMSSRYKINFTSLLMPEPLPLTKPPTDHRTRFAHSRLSIDTLVAIEDINEALEVFDDIANETRGIIPKLNIGSAELDERPWDVAARERKRFGVIMAQQRDWSSLAKARVEWRKRIEARGVFTYMISLPPSDLSGFSLLQDGLAAICVNDSEGNEGAKIFTLFHEYCHLLLRNTGISDEDDSNKIERFCNQFAASFLIPRQELDHAIATIVGKIEAPHEFSEDDVKELARWFRVSNRAIVLRLEKTGLAPDGFYWRRTALWKLSEPKPKIQGSQPSAIKIRIKQIGRLHTSTVLEAVKKHAINSFDASELIGLQPSTFKKIEAALG